MGARWQVAVLAILALVTAFPFGACGGSDHAVSAIDRDVPGELIVARDTHDDDTGEMFVVAADGSEARAVSEAAM